MKDLIALWTELLRNPRNLGTVAPSSTWLAEALIEASSLKPGVKVVEVGAGTGPLTEIILQHVSKDDFIALEPNDVLAEQLRGRFKGVTVLQKYASELPQVVASQGLEHVDRILCSLPWSVFTDEVLERNIKGITSVLSDEGIFVTLVYSHAKFFAASKKLRNYLSDHFEHVGLSETTWRNLPPGQWLVCSKPIRVSEE